MDEKGQNSVLQNKRSQSLGLTAKKNMSSLGGSNMRRESQEY